MSRVKQSPKRRRRSSAVPVLGAAGLSLALASGASAATASPDANVLMQNAGAGHEITLREEEVADVSLATFYVFDKENAASLRPGVRIAMGMCGGCAGCGGCGWLDRHLLHRAGLWRRRRCAAGQAQILRAQARAEEILKAHDRQKSVRDRNRETCRSRVFDFHIVKQRRSVRRRAQKTTPQNAANHGNIPHADCATRVEATCGSSFMCSSRR